MNKNNEVLFGWKSALFCAVNLFSVVAHAEVLDDACVINILNRTVQVGADGTWSVPNIPSNQGQVRARATCIRNGQTISGQTDYFTVVNNNTVEVPPVDFSQTTLVPQSLEITTFSALINQKGETSQLTVVAKFANNTAQDVTLAASGTNYISSNPAIATINSNGLVTSVSNGTVLITVRKDGVTQVISINVRFGGDTDGDGLPDEYELANGLNPNDSVDAFEDQDNDKLSNLEEFQRGTDPNSADTDSDGLSDGEEVAAGSDGFVTNPLLADTDGDGLSDLAEVTVGSSPIDGADANYTDAVVSLEVTPDNVSMTFNLINTEQSSQLTVTGTTIDGGLIDLTSKTFGTIYNSADLTVASFGLQDGELFAGQNGSTTVTVSFFNLSATANVVVDSFTPVALSAIDIPGYANNVDVSGDFAYVAAGSAGLQVVDVSDRTSPVIVASLDTTGISIDVRVVGNYAYIADGDAGLVIIDISNPLSPQLVSTFDTAGIAQDLKVDFKYAYVATGTGGLEIIDVSNPVSPLSKGWVDNIGEAKGVDVEGDLATVVASNSMYVIDVSDKDSPFKLGSINIGPVKDVAVSGNYAYVATYSSGYRVIDISNPILPVVVGGDASIAPRDVALTNGFAFFAEQLFPNVVAYFNTQDPQNTVFQGTINLSPFGDYAGTGIALDSAYAYITEESYVVSSDYSASGNTKLFIAQYQLINDNAGIAPTVVIDQPVNADVVVENSTIIVSASAFDDVTVKSVSFMVNNQVVFVDTTSPYQTQINVPGASNFTLSAVAIDLGGNSATSADVILTIDPDTDNDGLGDTEEVQTYNTYPDNPDSDSDGLSDGDEVARGTNPLNSDTDGDGISDFTEIDQQTDPLNPDVTAPHVLVVDPIDGSTDIAENSSVFITIDEPLLVTSIRADSVIVLDGTLPVVGRVSLVKGNTQIMFTPVDLLKDYTTYTVTLLKAKDIAGNPLSPAFTSSFTTGNTIDDQRPTVADSNPQFNAIDIAVNTTLSFAMSEAINPNTVTVDSLYVVDTLTQQRISGTVSVSEDKTVLYFVPDVAFPVGRKYYTYLTSAIEDLFGLTLSGTTRYFTTSLTADATSPQVVATTVRNGQIDIPTNVSLKVRFNEPISSLSMTDITLTDTFGERIPVTRSLSSNRLVVTLIPKLPLQANSSYSMLIDAIQDISGNPLANSIMHSFTTGAGVDIQSGTTLSFSPAYNSVVPANVRIQIQLSERVDPVTLYDEYRLRLGNTTTSQIVAFSHSVSADGRTITMTPDVLLELSHNYTVSFAGYPYYIYDLSGNIISGKSIPFSVGEDLDALASTVSRTTVINGSVDVAINTVLQVEFNESLDTTCVNNDTVQLLQGIDVISGSVSLADDQRTIVFTPSADLSVDTAYSLSIDGVCDYAGNLMSGYSSSFTTDSNVAGDTTYPSVTITPIYNAIDVAVDSAIVFSFSEPIDPTTLDTVTINASGLGDVDGRFTLNSDNTVATFTPDVALPSGYRIDFSAYNVTDRSGNNTRTGYPGRFTTALVSDSSKPTVTVSSPVDGMLDIARNMPVVLQFSEALDPSTVNSSNFVLFVNGVHTQASISRSGDSRTVTVTSRSGLAANSVVTVVVSNDVTDLAGNRLDDYVSVFSTATATESTRPSVVTFYPGGGSNNVASDRSLVFHINESMNVSTLTDAFKISENGVLINGSLNITGDGAVLEFTPDQPFAAGALVQVFLDSTAQDLNGNALYSYSTSFTVFGDATTLALVGQTPTGTVTISNPAIEARFNKPLDIASVTTENIYLWVNNAKVGASLSLVGDRTVQITPTVALAVNQSYSVIYTVGLTAVDGSVPSNSRSYSFVTAAQLLDDTQSPLVTAMSPPDGASDVALNVRKHLTFDEPMNVVSLLNRYETEAATLSFSNNNQDVKLVPHSPLAENSVITDVVDTVSDMAGNVVTSISSTYSTGTRLDRAAPILVSTDPVSGAIDVPTNTTFLFRFNERLDPVTLDVSLTDRLNGDAIPGTFALSADGQSVSFVPEAILAVGRDYQFSVGVYDLVGYANSYASRRINLTTGFADDVIAPTVELMTVEEGQTEVPTNARLRIRFSEAVQTSAVDNITLSDGMNEAVFNSSFSSDRRTLTLTPQQVLLGNTAYTLTIDGVADLTGNLLAAAQIRTFTTRAGVDIQSGTTLSFSPAYNSVVPANVRIQIQLSERVDPVTLYDEYRLRLGNTTTSQIVAFSHSVSADGRTITMTPDALLELSHNYTVSFATYPYFIYDLSGNAIGGRSTYFSVGEGEDVIAPAIDIASLVDGQTGVPTNSRFQIRFNEMINVLTLSGLSIIDELGAQLPITRTLASDQVTATLILQEDLLANSNYSLQIEGVEDISGNAIVTEVRAFSTGIGIDTASGSVSSSTPGHGEINVAITTPITVQLSEAIDPVSINSDSFRLYEQSTGQYIEGARLLSANGLELQFIPNADLLPAARYYIYTSYYDYIFDLAGNRINSSNRYFNTQ